MTDIRQASQRSHAAYSEYRNYGNMNKDNFCSEWLWRELLGTGKWKTQIWQQCRKLKKVTTTPTYEATLVDREHDGMWRRKVEWSGYKDLVTDLFIFQRGVLRKTQPNMFMNAINDVLTEPQLQNCSHEWQRFHVRNWEWLRFFRSLLKFFAFIASWKDSHILAIDNVFALRVLRSS